jgi:hypothetical protein
MTSHYLIDTSALTDTSAAARMRRPAPGDSAALATVRTKSWVQQLGNPSLPFALGGCQRGALGTRTP